MNRPILTADTKKQMLWVARTFGRMPQYEFEGCGFTAAQIRAAVKIGILRRRGAGFGMMYIWAA